jgi:hypothetical protein
MSVNICEFFGLDLLFLAHLVRNRREPLTATCGLDNLLMTSQIVFASVRGIYVWHIITVRCETAISTGLVRGLQYFSSVIFTLMAIK